jgi:protein-tyrosine phosphatase
VTGFAADLHCHVLPGLDDGATDLDDALAMAREAQAEGIEAICATPHIRHDHDVRIDQLPERLDVLRAALRQAGCATRILSGAEVAATALVGLTAQELRAVSLGGGGRWILLEPAPGPLDDGLDDAVDILRSRGFRALIAHPERHLAADLVPRLRRLAGHGALIQATAAFFVDEPAAAGMRSLAADGVVHVLGSDAHSSRGGRRVALAGALEQLAGVARCRPHLEWIARTAPAAIVAGQEIDAPF